MKETAIKNTKANIIFKSVLFCISFTALFVALTFFKSFIPEKFERFTHGIIGTIAAIFVTYVFLKFDKKSFADINLKWEKTTLKNFCIGVLIGIGIMGSLSLIVIYFSGFQIETNSNSNILKFLFWSLAFLPLAFMEEIGFRAYPLVILKDKAGIRYSIIITSVLFALYHIVNGWTIQNSFLGAGVWGIIYGLAAIYSKGIAMATGIHYAANVTTSLFDNSSNSFNLWDIKPANGLTMENYEPNQMMILLPQIIMLLLSIICMEWYIRKKNYR